MQKLKELIRELSESIRLTPQMVEILNHLNFKNEIEAILYHNFIKNPPKNPSKDPLLFLYKEGYVERTYKKMYQQYMYSITSYGKDELYKEFRRRDKEREEEEKRKQAMSGSKWTGKFCPICMLANKSKCDCPK
jgi:hypothetical protein